MSPPFSTITVSPPARSSTTSKTNSRPTLTDLGSPTQHRRESTEQIWPWIGGEYPTAVRSQQNLGFLGVWFHVFVAQEVVQEGACDHSGHSNSSYGARRLCRGHCNIRKEVHRESNFVSGKRQGPRLSVRISVRALLLLSCTTNRGCSENSLVYHEEIRYEQSKWCEHNGLLLSIAYT